MAQRLPAAPKTRDQDPSTGQPYATAPNPQNPPVDKSSASKFNDSGGCGLIMVTGNNVFVSCTAARISAFLLSLAADLLYRAGTMFDFSIDYSLNMAARLGEFKFVSNGWGVLRDVTNLAYIFILLYISINIILGNSGYGDKSLIAKVLITAVFVNFSLFGAKVIVDATNIGALQFYNLITPADTTGGNTADANARGLTGQFMNLFNLQSIYGNDGDTSTDSVLNSVGKSVDGAYDQSGTWWRIVKLCVFGILFIIAVIVVFAAGAILFLSRTITLFFLMLFASLAVASRALPATKGQFDSWLKKLINNSIFAPIFLGLIYIFVSATNNVGKGGNLANIILTGGNISAIVTFFMYLAFLVGLLLVAKQLGIKGGDAAHGFADKWLSPKSIGNRALGGAKMVGKGALNVGKGALVRTGGALATGIAESGLIKSTLGRVPILGGALAKVGDATGYKKVREERTKAYEAKDKYLSSVSPQGPLETDDEYSKRKDAAKARAKSAAGFDENGKKKKGFISNTLNMARWVTGGGAYTNFQNDKSKKYKKDAKTKTKVDADLLNHAKELGKLLYNNPNKFLDLSGPEPKIEHGDIDKKSGLFNGTLIDSSTGNLITDVDPNGNPIPFTGQISDLYIDLETAQHDYDTALRTRPTTDPAIVLAKNALDKVQSQFDKQEKKLKDQFDGFKNKFQQREAMED